MTSPISEDEIKYDPKRHNVYADKVDGSWVHISDAESGQKGYYCQGCSKELIAVKSKLPNRIHFFRHVAMDVKIERRCVFGDQTLRHKLAKEHLGRLKYVKVPAVYKWPPKGVVGDANFIRDAQFIEAYSVEMERVFYETEIGEIKWGSGHGIDEKYLLVRPDVVFFDSEKKPILFIELVATHKVDNEKKAKLRRLGIDCIEIIVPKDSPKAIETSLSNTKYTKWIYNHDEEITKYVSVSEGTSTGISSVDEQQKRLFAETFECRQAEVRNLIRTFTRVLESKQYGDVVQQLRDEISRVAGNTEENRSRLDRIQNDYRDEIIERHRERRQIIEEEKTEFEREEADLESRYNSKKNELRNTTKEVIRKTEIVERELSGESKIEDGTGNTDFRVKADLEFLISQEESEIRRIEQELETTTREDESKEQSIVDRFRKKSEAAKREIERVETEIAGIPRKFKEEVERIARDFQSQEEQLPTEFKTKEDELEREFEDLRNQSDQAVSRRNAVGNTEIANRIRRLLEARGILSDIESTQKLFRRYRKAWECFKEGAYENWLE